MIAGRPLTVEDHRAFRHNVICPGVVIMMNAKVGWTTIDHSLRWRKVDFRYTDADTELPADLPRLFVFRDPVARLLSCYAHQVTVHQCQQGGMALWCSHDISFDDFVAMVCDVPDAVSNIHFRSQSYGFNHERPRPQDVVVSLNELDSNWIAFRSAFGLPDLVERQNATKNKPVLSSDAQHDSIRGRYSMDYDWSNHRG